MRASAPSRRYASHVAFFSSIHEPSSCSLEGRCYTLMEDDVEMDSRFVVDGVLESTRRRLIDFPR